MKRYPVYKDSGVEWIGEIPIHWVVKRIKFITDNYDGKRIPLNSEERGNRKGGYPYYGANGILDYIDDFIFDGEFILVGEDGAPFFEDNKNVSLVTEGKFWVNNHSHIIKAKNGYLSRYISHSLNLVDYKLFITGSTRDKLTQNDLNRILISIPNLSEQSKITNFLNYKTKQIDDLIVKKQNLIELLKEKRTAIISQAVTKGIDPTVRMKDSGMEWLGEIPQHWEVKRLKFIANSVQTGNTPPSQNVEYYENPDTDWFTPSDFGENLFLNDSNRKINSISINSGVSKLFNPFSVLIVGIGATLGKVGVIKHYSSSNQQINSIEFKDKMNPIFGAYYLRIFEPVVRNLSNAATLAILNQTNTKSIVFTCPPKDEQDKIVDFIMTQNSQVELAISRIGKEINLISEYKTSLINETVTGKIDVRNHEIK